MKKLFAILVFIGCLSSCSEDCKVDNEKLSELGAEAEEIRLLLNNAQTPALRNVYQLQLDQKRKEMDDVAQACF